MAGGFASVDVGTAPDADTLAVTHADGETALDMAACIGWGACVAACPNGAAHLFAGAKLAHLALQPRGRMERARAIVDRLDEAFGPCSTHGECEPACPADIPLAAVARVNRERLRAWMTTRDD